MKWNATMPRKKPAKGGANVVLAFRASNGARYELECKMSEADADTLLASAVEMMKKYKENNNG